MGLKNAQNGQKLHCKSHVERSEQKSSENRPPHTQKSDHFGAIYILRGIFAIFGHFLPLTPAQYLKIKLFEMNSITWQQKYKFLKPVIF